MRGLSWAALRPANNERSQGDKGTEFKAAVSGDGIYDCWPRAGKREHDAAQTPQRRSEFYFYFDVVPPTA